jgi:hypothetical protein
MKAKTPDLVLTPEENERLQQLRLISRFMDDAFLIPGLNYRVGADALIGLIPGVGDVIGLVVSSYFVLAAARMQVPKLVIARMTVNVLADTLIGLIPVVGDIGDAIWKANRKNLELLERSLARPPQTQQRSLGFFILIFLGAAAAISGVVFLLVQLVRELSSFN